MEPSAVKSSTKEGSFGNKLIAVLKDTNYEGINVFTGSSKRLNELNAYESFEGMWPFIDWFSECITDENCVTREELEMYNNLKMNGKLVPENDLNTLLMNCNQNKKSDLGLMDYNSQIESAKKENEALQSLINILRKRRKNMDKQKQTSNIDFGKFIKIEVEELHRLNNEMNKALENYAASWKELRNVCSQRKLEPEGFSEDMLKKLNEMFIEIGQNVEYHLKNDFKEVSLIDGKCQCTPEEYWLVFQKFSGARSEIINTVGKTQALSLFKEKLERLRTEIIDLDGFYTIDDIRQALIEEPNLTALRNELPTLLQEEVNYIASLQLHDRKQSSTILRDRLDRLTKLCQILKETKLYAHTFMFIIKQNKIILDYQHEKLLTFLKEIETSFSKFEKRMDLLSNYIPLEVDRVDHNYKAMMSCLNVKRSDLKSLDNEIVALHDNIIKTNEYVNEKIVSIEYSILQRLKDIQDRNIILFDGPTREVLHKLFDKYLDPIESAQKTLNVLQNKISKIQKMFNELKCNSNPKPECIWMECLNDHKKFVESVFEIERQLSELTKKNEMLMKKECHLK